MTKNNRANKRGCLWYGRYRVPGDGGFVRIRLDALASDAFNREENLRPFPPGDADYKRIYGRRSDAESINSLLVRSNGQWGRAHSHGWRRQSLDLVGFALLGNATAIANLERRLAAGQPPDATTA